MPHSPKKPSLAPLLFTVLIDMIGVGIIIPVLAPVFLGPEGDLLLGGSSPAHKTFALGLLLAAYPFAQFFGAPYLGALSDRYGRKKLLILSLAGTVAGYLFFGFGLISHSLAILFISRLLDGFTGGNISIAMSAIADLSTPETKAKNFGLIGASFGFGFIIGPWLGGQLADPHVVSWFNDATPLWAAAALAALNILLLARNFQETLDPQHAVQTPLSFFKGFSDIAQAFSLAHLRRLFLVSLFYALGFNFFTQFFQVFLVEKFNFSHAEIGNFFGFVGIWIVFTQAIVMRFLSKRFAPQSILSVCLPFFALATLAYLLPSQSIMLFFIAPFFSLLQGLSMPNISALISNVAAPNEQGRILGINQSLQSAAMTLPPIVSGVVFSLNRNLPIIFSAALILVAWFILLSASRQNSASKV